MPKYRAITNGTLNNPYRFVERGEIVDLPKALEKPSKWLIPLETIGTKPLPEPSIFQPELNPNDSARRLHEIKVAPVAEQSAYQQQINTLIKHEQANPIQSAPVQSAPEPVVENQPGGEAEGTGNQEVL